MADLSARLDQMFPVLNPHQVETAKRFASGEPKYFARGDFVYKVGDHAAPAWLVLKGSMDVFRHEGLSGEAPITTHGAGQLSGESTSCRVDRHLPGPAPGPRAARPFPLMPPICGPW